MAQNKIKDAKIDTITPNLLSFPQNRNLKGLRAGGEEVVDTIGLVSIKNFFFDQASVAGGTQLITNTDYEDITTPQLTFTASKTRVTNVLFFGMLTYSTGSSSGANVIMTLEDNISLSATFVGSFRVTATFIAVKENLSAGEHTLKFRGRQIDLAINVHDSPRFLGYLLLGS